MAAGNATIGALRVTLGADTAELEKGLKSSQVAIAAFAGAIGGAMTKVADQVVSTVGQLSHTFTKIIDDMDKLGKESQKLGISTEELSKLAFAADLADVSFEALSKGIVKLSKNISSAIVTPSGDAARAFKALGVSMQDLKTSSPDEVFAKVAKRFSELEDGSGKTAAAIAIFGKAGADLIPLLNEGEDGLKKLKDRAEEFGLTISAGTAKAAQDFNDRLKDLASITKGVFVRALSEVLPTLASIAEQMVESKKNSGFLSVALTVLTDAMKGAITVFVVANALFERTAAGFANFASAVASAVSGDFIGAFNKFKDGAQGLDEISARAKKTITELWSGQAVKANEAAAAAENAAKGQEKFNFAALAGKNAVDTFIDSQNKKLAQLTAEIATFGQYTGAVEAAKVQEEALAIAKSNGLTISATQQAALDKLTLSIEAEKLELEGLQLVQANLSPAEALAKQQEKIQFLFDNGVISADQYGNAMKNAAEKAQATWDIAGASIAGSFKDIATSFGKENSSMAALAKVFGIIQSTISMFTGAAKALELPFPANLAAMAAVLAKGAALVASIRSTSVPNAATGLSTVVPGGLGGGDSKLFQSLVEPGEHINITPNSQTQQRGAVVEIRGLTDRRYNLDEVKQIMKGIGDAMKFGYKFENA